ncbi:hypothetical protein ETB97_000471 [Aspergillus alliaceus]|uniref:Uncharacterized protein n=1 Tax=Petromyces alliaceus TaxID=209559 RepID=A0A8H6A5Z5_PETAA|nr:hypothetical protein ETB97_000471 [Aspergillus burnettii]
MPPRTSTGFTGWNLDPTPEDTLWVGGPLIPAATKASSRTPAKGRQHIYGKLCILTAVQIANAQVKLIVNAEARGFGVEGRKLKRSLLE